MAKKNQKMPVIRQPKQEVKKMGPPKAERPSDRPPVLDPRGPRTPLNVASKITGIEEHSHARGNFTTPFNLTPRVQDEEV